jgi:hypothetical protein
MVKVAYIFFKSFEMQRYIYISIHFLHRLDCTLHNILYFLFSTWYILTHFHFNMLRFTLLLLGSIWCFLHGFAIIYSASPYSY